MALSFNPLLKGQVSNTKGIPYSILYNSFGGSNPSPIRLRLYPDTVAMPTTAPLNGSSLPAGYIAEFSSVTTSVSTSGLISSTGVNTTVNTTGAGTIAWASYYSFSSGAAVWITDSVVVNGENGIISVSPSLTVTSGQSVTIALSFKINF